MINQTTQKYLQRLSRHQQLKTEEETLAKIHVDHVALKIATLYEKLRQVIDYQEEHLLKRNAIQRTLGRRLFLNDKPEGIAQPLIQELIRGGYFSNDRIPETKIEEIKKVIGKYLLLLNNLPASLSYEEKREVSSWIQSLCSCEIEEKLSPPLKENALLYYMVEVMVNRIEVKGALSAEETNLQVFIGCQKALLKSDETLISFRLFKYHQPDWSNQENPNISSVAERIFSLKKEVDREIANPLGRKIFQLILRHTAPFLIIGDVVSPDPIEAQQLLEKPELLERKLLEAYKKRYNACRTKIRRSGTRSVISILLSKILLAFLIEIPVDAYVTKKFSLPVLAVNLLVPPSLMFVIASSIKPPKAEVAPLVVMEAIGYLKAATGAEPYIVKPPKSRGLFLNIVSTAIFLLVSGAVFWGIVWLLLKINFSILSILIFFAFISLIAFSGLKTGQWARELNTEEEKDSIASFITDIVFLPFVRVGKMLSIQIQRYNLIILLLNLFFEAPLQTFFEFLESWRGYLKEKKEEME